MKTSFINKTLVLSIFLFASVAFGQLSDKHYIAPIKSKNDNIGKYSLYLSTPQTTPLTVTVLSGTGTAIAGSPFNISRDNPVKVALGEGNASLMVDNNGGLQLSATNNFYASVRNDNTTDNEVIVSKGMAALGHEFRLGGFPFKKIGDDASNYFVSIKSTEPNTIVTFNDINKNLTSTSVFPEFLVLVARGSSVSLSGNIEASKDYNGIIGGLISANKPIVVTVGNAFPEALDFAYDQIVPVERTGKEYILIKGNGPNKYEFPMVVAHEDNTQIQVNGSTLATINAGEFFEIPASNYRGNINANMHIKLSKKGYVYQFVSGRNNEISIGMQLVPSIDNLGPQEELVIPFINEIADTDYNTDIGIISPINNTIRINDIPISAIAEPVTSRLEWVTYKINNVSSLNRISSTNPILVSAFGRGSRSGFTEYYSDFNYLPAGNQTIEVCNKDTDIAREIGMDRSTTLANFTNAFTSGNNTFNSSVDNFANYTANIASIPAQSVTVSIREAYRPIITNGSVDDLDGGNEACINKDTSFTVNVPSIRDGRYLVDYDVKSPNRSDNTRRVVEVKGGKFDILTGFREEGDNKLVINKIYRLDKVRCDSGGATTATSNNNSFESNTVAVKTPPRTLRFSADNVSACLSTNNDIELVIKSNDLTSGVDYNIKHKITAPDNTVVYDEERTFVYRVGNNGNPDTWVYTIPRNLLPQEGIYNVLYTQITNNSNGSSNSCLDPSSTPNSVTSEINIQSSPDIRAITIEDVNKNSEICYAVAPKLYLLFPNADPTADPYTVIYDFGNGTIRRPTTLIKEDGNRYKLERVILPNINKGNKTIRILSIQNQLGCPVPLNLQKTFGSRDTLNVNGMTVTVPDKTCVTKDVIASVSTPTLGGLFNIEYVLKGANNGGPVVNIIKTPNDGFTIPGQNLPNKGDTTVEITSISLEINGVNHCPTMISVEDTFNVGTYLEPTAWSLISDPSFTFCGAQNGVDVLFDTSGNLWNTNSDNFLMDITIQPDQGASTTQRLVAQATIHPRPELLRVSYNIPSNLLQNGSGSIQLSDVVDQKTGCTNGVKNKLSYQVSQKPDINGLSVTAVGGCADNNSTVTIMAPNLINGEVYSFQLELKNGNLNYDLTRRARLVNNEAEITLGIYPKGDYVLSIKEISNNSGCITTIGTANAITTNLKISEKLNLIGIDFNADITCIGKDMQITMKAPNLPNGNYEIDYELIGVNNCNGTANFVLTNSQGNFVIPTSCLPNVGDSSINFSGLLNNNNNCKQSVPVTKTGTVIRQLDESRITVSADDTCLNNPTTAYIRSDRFLDGIYKFKYSLSGDNTSVSREIVTNATNNTIQYTIPGTEFRNAGNNTVFRLESLARIGANCSTLNNITTKSASFKVLDFRPQGLNFTLSNTCDSEKIDITISTLGKLNIGDDINFEFEFEDAEGNKSYKNVETTINSNTNVFASIDSDNIEKGIYTVRLSKITRVQTSCDYIDPTPPQNTLYLSKKINIDINSQIVISENCIGISSTVNLNHPKIIAGTTYDISYKIAGRNTSNIITTSVTGNTGNLQFIINGTLLNNEGISRLRIERISEHLPTKTCQIIGNVLIKEFRVHRPNIVQSELSYTLFCNNTADIIIKTNQLGMFDGVYNISYKINEKILNSNVTFTNRIGMIKLTQNLFPNRGNTNVVFVAIQRNDSKKICQQPLNNIVLNIPTIGNELELNRASIQVKNICLGKSGKVKFFNLKTPASANYTMTYSLSGNNTKSNINNEISFDTSQQEFEIPTKYLLNVGTTKVTIHNLIYADISCQGNNLNISSDFQIKKIPQDVIVNKKIIYLCEDDSHPVSKLNELLDLNANKKYQWYSGSKGNNPIADDETLTSGNYFVETQNEIGCPSKQRTQVTVDFDTCANLFIPDAFSPNGDEINDTFEIKGIRQLSPNFILKIYDRNGILIYEGNKDTPDFDGSINKKITNIARTKVPDGVYYYSIHYNNTKNTKPHEGMFYLRR